MLIDCPECRKQVSDSAELCPHCGYRILGRENLVHCPHCNTDVIPETNPHSTISRYCPLCKRAITNLGCRTAFVVI